MSDMGLYSGLYDQISEHAALFDRVLIGLRSGESNPHEPARQQLADLLMEVATASSSNISLRALDIALRDSPVSDRAVWTQIAHALRNVDVEPATVTRLEQMALALEAERTGTLARMRGWSR